MSVWDDLTGQDEAIAVFRAAVRAATEAAVATDTDSDSDSADRDAPHGGGSSAMTHSWLITGPPGSGRSNLAFAFATALLSGNPDGDAATAKQVAARTHPDLAVLSTERVIITIDEVRELLASSQFSPSVARHRVMVIEDADRMTERTSNLLLKSLEEPPPRTVWVLCAPSEADLIPTIRSRVRSVRLRIPAVEDVARLLEARDGVEPGLALRAAREAQSHIGMAHRLATDEDARRRREKTMRAVLDIRSVPDAVRAAGDLHAIATEDAKALTEQRDAEERASALRSLGVEPGGTIPPALRSQLKALEEDQKRRATRSLRDGIDRILIDLQSLFRDILLVQMGARVDLVNGAIATEVHTAAQHFAPQQTLAVLDAIATARHRIEGNVAPTLALEAMLVSVTRRDAA